MLTRRLLQLFIGLFLYGFADALMIRAAVGVDPWTVFAQGLSHLTGIEIGWLTNLIGLFVLLLWVPLRQKPGMGTVFNILLVGTSIQAGLALVGTPPELWQRILLFTAGLLLLAVASGLYIGSRFGAGPRDGLMTGINARTGMPIWIARTIVEVTVLAVGWLLGGDVGFGTLAFAVLIGPLCGLTIPRLRVPERVGAAPVAADSGAAPTAGASSAAGSQVSDRGGAGSGVIVAEGAEIPAPSAAPTAADPRRVAAN